MVLLYANITCLASHFLDFSLTHYYLYRDDVPSVGLAIMSTSQTRRRTVSRQAELPEGQNSAYPGLALREGQTFEIN
jgi:hypothetical protein